MRIVLDLQSCQTEGSKNRGIGRYSIALVEAMIRQGAGEHEFFVVLNGAFPEAAAAVRAFLRDKIPAENIRTFEPVVTGGHRNEPNSWRNQMSLLLREELIANLRPDAVHVTSLFEGLGDFSVTDLSPPHDGVIQAVTVYDLIPYINPDPYLRAHETRDWYYRKLLSLKRADLLLAISSSSRDEAIEYMHVPAERVVNISSAISPVFAPVDLDETHRKALRKRYHLNGRYVMYTGGIDHRKNIEGLIEAFALLSADLRRDRQLAIVCSISVQQREALLEVAKDFGLEDGQVVMTGYVPEEDLIALYNSCEMFVFPSLHEGFGLPVLEAMSCGVPTIGSDSSSIPEVIGWDEALFDPKDPLAIAEKIARVLTDRDFAERLTAHGLEQSRLFSWDESARRALRAIEAAKADAGIPTMQRDGGPLRLAYISPFRPLNSGIASYSASLLPELSRYYDIDIVVDQKTVDCDWATANCNIVSIEEFERRSDAGYYSRTLYHFGNSEFHAHMPGLLLRHPGVVVLHDYFLSGLQNWRQAKGADGVYIDALLDSHGYHAVEHLASAGVESTITRYPANGPVVRSAAGIIVHSRSSLERLEKDYGVVPGRGARHIPHLRTNPTISRANARKTLGLAPDEILVCSFGIVAPEKLSQLVLAAFAAAGLASDERVRLVFVGAAPGAYGETLSRKIKSIGRAERISCTGYIDDSIYHRYLAASDLAIQLRTNSRGETSGAVLDVFNYGIPLIVNAHGTMAELDRSAVAMLDDAVTADMLAAEIKRLIQNPDERAALGRAGKSLIDTQHIPELAGRLYHNAIESFAAQHPLSRHSQLLHKAVQAARQSQVEPEEIASFAASSARNVQYLGQRRMFVDISGSLVDAGGGLHMHWALEAIDGLLAQNGPYRIEPVYMATGETRFRAARKFMVARMGWQGGGVDDVLILPEQGDLFLGLNCSLHSAEVAKAQSLYARWKAHGVKVVHVLRHEDVLLGAGQSDGDRASLGDRFLWLSRIAEAADMIATSSEAAAVALHDALDMAAPPRREHLDIVYMPVPVADEGLALIGVAVSPDCRTIQWVPRPSHHFDGKSPRLSSVCGERLGSTIASTGQAGTLVFGPYLALPPGSYEARVWGTMASEGSTGGYVDAATDSGEKVVGRSEMTPSTSGHFEVGMLARLSLRLDKGCDDLEVRLWVDTDANVIFHRLDIREVDPV